MIIAICAILILSVTLQLTAAFYALWLIKITGLKFSWIFISSSLVLMVLRRMGSLYHYVFSDPSPGIHLNNEIAGLVLSALMLVGVRGIGPIFMEQKMSEKRIRSLLEEKETLIRELFHRTRNIMQIIRGLLILQADEYDQNREIQQLVQTTDNRIQAISLVHQKLYNNQDLSHISIKEYIEELSACIIQSQNVSGDRISLNINADNIYYLIDTVIPLGLILNELLMNSFKHAFPGNRKGSININLEKNDSGENILSYHDDGVGLDSGFEFRVQSTLGLRLIQTIGEHQMQGMVELKNDGGLSCMIRFPDNLYSTRV